MSSRSTLLGTAAIIGLGNELDNALFGNDASNALFGYVGDDTLDGLAGDDVLIGGLGNDTYIVTAGDTVIELANAGTDVVMASTTWTLGSHLEDLTLTGAGAINGTGNALDNVLTGNGAANVLSGGTGNDVYVAGLGDTVVEAASAGTDTVMASVTWTLERNVEHLTLTGTSAIHGTGQQAGQHHHRQHCRQRPGRRRWCRHVDRWRRQRRLHRRRCR